MNKLCIGQENFYVVEKSLKKNVSVALHQDLKIAFLFLSLVTCIAQMAKEGCPSFLLRERKLRDLCNGKCQ